ncbi:MAG: helix-turn-helix domain-containing protein [Planctomycetes bacterium]|nr:helix-turn-helix domain-containing protein [Planctomycetota bacterium]
MRTKKRKTTDAIAIMDALWGKEPGWKEGVARERQKIALGEVIRQAREARGWTQKQLARKAGTSQSYISRIEDADYDRLMIATLEKIAVTLELPLTITLGSQTVQLQPA